MLHCSACWLQSSARIRYPSALEVVGIFNASLVSIPLASFCEPDGSELFSRDVITFYMGGKFDLWHERLVQTTGRAVELQAIHRYVLETPKLDDVTEEVRAVVETVWPELLVKLPPRP